MVSIYDNVRYLSGISSLNADRAEIDILKQQKVFMDDPNKKVQINNKSENGTIKKFRIKSFKQKKPILKLENVSLSFGNRQILENINFEINKGEIFGMLGPNGVGKSTIFNLVTGLISPEKGSIFIGGKRLIIFQYFLGLLNLNWLCPTIRGYFYDLTLFENLCGGEILIQNPRDRIEKINYLTSKFDLESIRHKSKIFIRWSEEKIGNCYGSSGKS